MSLFSTLTENRTVAITALLGAAAGGVGGALLGGGSLMTTVILGALFSVGGLAIGAFGGSKLAGYQDSKTPAPLGGVRPVPTAKVEAGKAGEVSVKPSYKLADNVAEKLDSLKGTPEYEQIKGYMPLIKQALPLSKLTMTGTANAAGDHMDIAKVVVESPVPGVPSIEFAPTGISMPLVNGQIDQNSPEAKAQLMKLMEQAVEQKVPEALRPKVRELLKDALEKSTTALAPVQTETSVSSIAGDTMKTLESAPVKALVATLARTGASHAMSGQAANTAIPVLRPNNGNILS